MAECMFLTIITESWETVSEKYYTVDRDSPQTREMHN